VITHVVCSCSLRCM